MAEISFLEEHRKQIFSSRSEFTRDMLTQLNRLNNSESFYHWRVTGKYVIIKCNHCHNFQIWYTFKKTASDEFTDITFCRNINLGHIRAKHPAVHIATAESKSASL